MTTYTLIRERMVKARKEHRCIWCGEKILIGSTYRHEVSRYDDLQDHKWHPECDAEASECFRQGDCEFIPYENERPAVSEVAARE